MAWRSNSLLKMEEVARNMMIEEPELELVILAHRRAQIPEGLHEYKVNGTVVLVGKLLISLRSPNSDHAAFRTCRSSPDICQPPGRGLWHHVAAR